MFSKPVLNNEVLDDDSKNEVINTLNYKDYFKNDVNLSKMKLPELKKIAKAHKLLVSGKKAIIVDRIENRFIKDRSASLIQNISKGYVVRRLLNNLQSKVDKNDYVNGTDFYTLEPLEDIDRELFFSYKDEDNFEYGFNILSLLLLIKNSKKLNRFNMDLKLLSVLVSHLELIDIKNPYNRSKINKDVVLRILKNVLLINLIFPQYLEDILVCKSNTNNVNYISRHRVGGNNILSNNDITQRNIRDRLNRLRGENRSQEDRIETLFMEIDGLGNYTQSSWFSRLTNEDYLRLYRYLHEIWYYRGQISHDVRRRICALEDPFRESIGIMGFNRNDRTDTQHLCLRLFEYMVYTGIDDEHRKIGALHALRALTLVSREARVAMPYLYESLY